MKSLNTVSIWLVIIGGLNWGLVAINKDWDLVAKIFGGVDSVWARIIYALVGLAALVILVNQFTGEEK